MGCVSCGWPPACLSPRPETAHKMAPTIRNTTTAPPPAARIRVRADGPELVSATGSATAPAVRRALRGAGAGAGVTRLRVAVVAAVVAVRDAVCIVDGRAGERDELPETLL